MSTKINVIYDEFCPVCGEELSTKEIINHVCNKKNKPLITPFQISELEEFYELFKLLIGEPRSIQKVWIKRFLKNTSFALTAPTGIGKTKFGLIAAIYNALKNKKSYLVFPTSLLVKQAINDLNNFLSKLEKEANSSPISVVGYYSEMTNTQKTEVKNTIMKKQFQILITTTQFLTRNYDLLKNIKFNFIFVDDVDSLLKNSKNVNKILSLLGFQLKNNRWAGKPTGNLLIASATAKPGKITKLFRELLNFDVGGASYLLRDIYDIFINEKTVNKLANLLKRMGAGGIVYADTTENAEKLFNDLSKEGIKVGLVTAQNKKAFDLFAKGELDVLIGTSHYYGTLIRGLDLPEKIYYVIFWGTPTFQINIDETIPLSILKQLILRFYDTPGIEPFRAILKKEFDPVKNEDLILSASEFIKKQLQAKDSNLEDIAIINNTLYLPDVKTYIQGSGRTSRLLPWGLTKGISIILENNEQILKAFIRKAEYYNITLQEFKNLDLNKIISEALESRSPDSNKKFTKDTIKPVLFIVESPTKAKQIAKYFGRPSIRQLDNILAYEVATDKYLLFVTASLGHVTDLTIGKEYHGVKIIDENQFLPIYSPIYKCKNCGYQTSAKILTCPKCGSSDILTSLDRINDLRKLAYETENVIVGTDPDAEGEKIAWDLQNLLNGIAKVSRAEFHEVTPTAIKNALEKTRKIDESKVNAQIVRRIEDRWIGFILSQHLQSKYNKRNLTAGRVQTPVLGWIIAQEEKSKKKKLVYQIKELGIDLFEISEETQSPKSELVCLTRISKTKTKKTDVNPLPPFTTDVLLREANSKLKYSSSETMSIAQKLFETGLITYHRTDSTHVSDNGLSIAKRYLKQEFHGRKWGTEGTHECIRPTKPYPAKIIRQLINENIIYGEELTEKHLLLYDLIFRRFMASQAKKISVTKEIYTISYETEEKKGQKQVTVITDVKGYAHELYPFLVIQKPLPEGEHTFKIKPKQIKLATPYNEADIIQLMKQRGIGRPSTYAITIEKLLQRKYVFKKNNFILSTELGKTVYNYLSNNFSHLISEERTRKLIEKMDAVEKGTADPLTLIKEIYVETKFS